MIKFSTKMIHFLENSTVEILFNFKSEFFEFFEIKQLGPFNLTTLIGFDDARKRWN